MKWSMDTHKYISEVTRKALKVLFEKNITSESSAEEIDAAEHILADENVYKDYKGAKGRIRRALFTYFKAYGCMDETEHPTEMGHLFADGKISVTEFSFWYIVNYKYENEDEDISYYPTKLILKVLRMLNATDMKQAYITPYDFSAIVDCNSEDEIDDMFIHRLLEVRETEIPEVNERAIGYDVWSKMLLQAGILEKNESKYLVERNEQLIDWILDAYDKDIEINGKVNSGILRYIPLIPIHSIEGYAEDYTNESAFVASYLFEIVDNQFFEKYIIRDKNNSIDDILLAFGLSEKEKAFYSSFHGIEHLIGAILCQEDNLAIQNIGNILLNLPVFETLENYQQPYVKLKFNTGYNKTSPERNRIIFGAPGTGKSYKLKKESLDLLRNTNGSYERVTFHPDYSYSQFVGTYKPVMGADEKIRYDFVPGPFMRVYVEALESGRTENPQPHLLLIEEINRAKVAAVFGDVFQLLDRDDDGVSEYEIQASEDIRKYLAKQLGGTPDNYQKIRIPNNMFIWSTMNSADQGVFPMDTAFKRRWNFEYLGINENEEKISGIGKIELAGSDEPIEWNILRRAINAKMSSDQFKINEDKLMGPFFLSKKVIASDENGMIIDTKKFVDAFKSKVIMYLYEDAVKQGKHRFFDGCDNSKYSSVCDAFDEIGMGIFGSNFKENFYDKQKDEA